MHFNCRNLNGTARFFSNVMLAVHMGQTNSSNKFAANLNNMKAVSFFFTHPVYMGIFELRLYDRA